MDWLPRNGRWVFQSPQVDGPVSGAVFEMFWRRVRKEADIVDARLHDLRHTYASIAIMQGETITTTGRLLGHSHPATTLKYTHLSEDPVREAVEALGDILGWA